jgi:HPt (histidine-containing phosphotransfer) domain-containing protein
MVDVLSGPAVLPEGIMPDRAAAPCSAASCGLPIDRDHLARMTLGEPGLDREVLRLFDQQSHMLLARMAREAPNAVAAHAHTLAGSARGIGAWKVAEAAAVLERQAGQPGGSLTTALRALATDIAEVRAAIADLLQQR